MGLFDFFSSDIAIDLGTANTLIIFKDKIAVDEPSIIAIDKNTNKVIAIGRDAMQMHEKTCYFNPANKRCGSCAHSELQDGYGNTLCMNDEVTQEHWIDIEEEKGPCEFHKAK